MDTFSQILQRAKNSPSMHQILTNELADKQQAIVNAFRRLDSDNFYISKFWPQNDEYDLYGTSKKAIARELLIDDRSGYFQELCLDGELTDAIVDFVRALLKAQVVYHDC